MKDVLVIQLARLGDLVQTKRLVRTLEQRGTVHLLVDASLAALAAGVYPQAVVHAVDAHRPPDPAALLAGLGQLAGQPFETVYNLNYSGLNLAVSTLFDPDIVRGHHLRQGQPRKDPLTAMAFRLTARRRPWGVNLADLWAGLARPMIDPRLVNPDAGLAVRPDARQDARPGGGGLGVVLAGRQARRSLPPQVLAPLTVAALAGAGRARITLLGSAAERGQARAFAALLPARLQGALTDLTGKTSLADLPGVLAGMDRLLTPDTGLMHLAAHLGVPVTAFFLSSAWCHETGPYGLGHTVWQAAADCAPCLEAAPCPHAVACLEPFTQRGLLRHMAGAGQDAALPGLVGFRTDFDALGTVNTAFAGQDLFAAERARLRAFWSRHLGLAGGPHLTPAPDLAELLVSDPDFMLPRTSAGEFLSGADT